MMKNQRFAVKGILLVVGLALVCSGTVEAQRQTIGNELNLRGIRLNEPDVDSALRKVAAIFRVPIGFEPQSGPLPKVPVILELSNATLSSVLDEVARYEPGYEWKEVDGVIRFFPKAGVDPLVQDILETRIAVFCLKRNSNSVDAGEMLAQSPEMAARLNDWGVVPLHFSNSWNSSRIVNPDAQIDLKNASVREILIAIAIQSQTKYWTIIRWGNDDNVVTIGS